MNEKQISLILLFLIAAVCLIGAIDYEEEKEQEEHYCYMRKIWEENKKVPENKRDGWPNFKPEIDCKL